VSRGCQSGGPTGGRVSSTYTPPSVSPPSLPELGRATVRRVPTGSFSVGRVSYTTDTFRADIRPIRPGGWRTINHTLPSPPNLQPTLIPSTQIYSFPHPTPQYLNMPSVRFSPTTTTLPSIRLTPPRIPPMPTIPEVSIEDVSSSIDVNIPDVSVVINTYTSTIRELVDRIIDETDRSISGTNFSVDTYNVVGEMGYQSVLEGRKENLISHLNSNYGLYRQYALGKLDLSRLSLKLDGIAAKARIVYQANSEKVSVYLPYLDAIVRNIKMKLQAQLAKYRAEAVKNIAILQTNRAIVQRNQSVIKTYKAILNAYQSIYELNQGHLKLLSAGVELNEAAVSVYTHQMAVSEKLMSINDANIRVFKDYADGFLRSLQGKFEEIQRKVNEAEIEVNNSRLEGLEIPLEALRVELEALNQKYTSELDAYLRSVDALNSRLDILRELILITNQVDNAYGEAVDAKIRKLEAMAKAKLKDAAMDLEQYLLNLKIQVDSEIVSAEGRVRKAIGEVEAANAIASTKRTEQQAQAMFYTAKIREAVNNAQAQLCMAVTEALG